jgi:phosphatidylserine/phosphatidylglycerophosphate/cardiolipin synthase-like enzyme
MNNPVRHRPWHRALPAGLSFIGGIHDASYVAFLADKTWIDNSGARHSEQEIFDCALGMIEKSRRFLLLDMFLYNDFQGKEPETTRLLSGEFTDALVSHKKANPDIRILVITDPINVVYGSLPSEQFARLRQAGIDVVMTDLTRLRDSNPAYSILWRSIMRPFGNSTEGTFGNPFGGKGRVTLRSYLEMLNFKANHRKVVIADDGHDWRALVTSANLHDASSAHTNVAVSFSGVAVRDLLQTEEAVLAFTGHEPLQEEIDPPQQTPGVSAQILTERAIKAAVLEIIDESHRNERLGLATFYLSDRDVIAALKRARRRRVALRVLLDPNKDAFGHSKFGIPNRPVAAELTREGIELRWIHTHGEQCHTKMVLQENMTGEAIVLLGSANLTRRNLDNFNLETNVMVRSLATSQFFKDAKFHFDLLWYNQHNRLFSVPYEHYRDESLSKKYP